MRGAPLGVIASSVQIATGPIPTTGLMFWYDADDASKVFLTTGRVTTLLDKSGNARSLVPPGGGSGPLLVLGGMKAGRNGMSFDGSTSPPRDLVSSADGTANQKPFSVSVALLHSAAATYRAILGSWNSGGLEWRLSNAQRQSVVQQYVAEIGQSTSVVPTFVSVLTITYSATGVLSFYENGVADGVVTNDVAFNAVSNQIRIGEAIGEPFVGSIGEMVKYDHVLTTTERQQVEGYLMNKWCATNGFIAFPGANGNFVSFGAPAAYQITGDIDLAWIGTISNYATTQALFSRFTGSGTSRSWLLRWFASTGIDFFMSTTGADQPTVRYNFTPPAAGTPFGIRIQRVQSTGMTTCFTTTGLDIETATWTQLGSPVAVAAGSAIWNAAGVNVGLGGHSVGTSTSPLGRCYGAELRAGIGTAPVMRFTGAELTAADLNSFFPTINAATAATVTRGATPLTINPEGTPA